MPGKKKAAYFIVVVCTFPGLLECIEYSICFTLPPTYDRAIKEQTNTLARNNMDMVGEAAVQRPLTLLWMGADSRQC